MFRFGLRNLQGRLLTQSLYRKRYPSFFTPCAFGRSTMSTERVLYEDVDFGLYEDVEFGERLAYYHPGGYHPIAIGDRLHGRYRVVHKLGHGGYSTIWLARDERLAKYVAVKVARADSDQKEADVLSQLTVSYPRHDDRARACIPPVLDRFHIHGPNGSHPCLVTTPARCSVSTAKVASSDYIFQLSVARALAAQLAMAVAYVHDLGYVHGDLHLGNLLFQLPSSLDHLSEKQLYHQFKPSNPEPVTRLDGKPLAPGVPKHVIPPLRLGKRGEHYTLAEARLLLVDFGVAFRPAQESRFESYTPLNIRPPEAHLEPTTPLSFPSDIWSLACTIWEILGQRGFLDGFLFGEDDATVDQVDALGPLPPEWWEKFRKTRECLEAFDGNGRPKEGRFQWTWDQRFEDSIQAPRRESGPGTLDDREKVEFLEMMRWMLAFRPGERPSAQQVLQTAWMRNWAIPESVKTWGRNLTSTSGAEHVLRDIPLSPSSPPFQI